MNKRRRYRALASDYDGTLATDGRVDAETLAALRRFTASGRMLLLITGRKLDELLHVFPEVEAFDVVLSPPPSREFIAALRVRGVKPLQVGRSLVATVHPYEDVVFEVLREQALDLQVIFNKGSVMVLPPGI